MVPVACAAALLLLMTSIASAEEPLPHAAEIQLFATTIAIARTVRETCPGSTPDDNFLEALRQRLHVIDNDYQAFAEQAHQVAEVLMKGLHEAPSREAWCAAASRLYGPEGTMIRSLLIR